LLVWSWLFCVILVVGCVCTLLIGLALACGRVCTQRPSDRHQIPRAIALDAKHRRGYRRARSR